MKVSIENDVALVSMNMDDIDIILGHLEIVGYKFKRPKFKMQELFLTHFIFKQPMLSNDCPRVTIHYSLKKD